MSGVKQTVIALMAEKKTPVGNVWQECFGVFSTPELADAEAVRVVEKLSLTDATKMYQWNFEGMQPFRFSPGLGVQVAKNKVKAPKGWHHVVMAVLDELIEPFVEMHGYTLDESVLGNEVMIRRWEKADDSSPF
jgi:hypothetical protein